MLQFVTSYMVGGRASRKTEKSSACQRKQTLEESEEGTAGSGVKEIGVVASWFILCLKRLCLSWSQ